MTHDTATLEGFLAQYAKDTGRIALDLDMLDAYKNEHSPFIILRSGDDVVILNPMQFKDHLCVDVHTFVDGKRARTGVFGMEDGRRISFPKDQTQGTSHRWPATKLVVLLVGDQKDTP